MNYRVLGWDSCFFGLRVAQVTVESIVDSHCLSDCLEHSDAEVIYVFLNSEVAEKYCTVLNAFSGKCYDQKITFKHKMTSASATLDDSIVEAKVESEELLQLAYDSGHLSRFFLDPYFRPHFKALYAEWVRKALKEENAKVFTLSDAHRMQGMVTASVENGVGKIGLIAIDENSRGQGLGIRLLKRCEAYYDSLNARTCKVVTQRDNVAACKLYEKAGYTIENEQDVWHIWKKDRNLNHAPGCKKI